jgi:hypothetical protein
MPSCVLFSFFVAILALDEEAQATACALASSRNSGWWMEDVDSWLIGLASFCDIRDGEGSFVRQIWQRFSFVKSFD